MKRLIGSLTAVALLTLTAGAQHILTGNSYTQDFNSIGSGLPANWSVRTGATASTNGAAAAFTTTATAWTTTSGGFFNVASITNDTGGASTGAESPATQASYTNRQVGIKQANAQDPGAALMFQILGTAGYSNLVCSVDFTMLSNATRETTWTVDYGFGATPGTFTTLGTYVNSGAFGTTSRETYNLGADANDQSQVITIRIVALTASTGTGSRDLLGVDNFALTYEGAAAPVPPTITSSPQSQSALQGTTVKFTVLASGPNLSYQWRTNGVNLANGGQYSGVTSNVLTIAGVTTANQADYTVVVSNLDGSVTNDPAATLTVTTSGILTRWDFNGTFSTTAPVPAIGSGTASLVGGTTATSAAGSANDPGAPNNSWNTTTYPAQGTANKTAGPRFNVDTSNLRNLQVSYDTRGSATGTRYTRLQYTTNGTDFIDYPTSAALTQSSDFDPTLTFDLAGFPGARNNPNFGFRIVAEFESTATYGASANDNYVGTTGGYGTTGTRRYDLVTVSAESITDASASPTVSSVASFTVADDVGATNVTITVTDADTADGALTVTGVSKNPSVLADASVSGGPGTRTLTFSPTPGLNGIVPVIVTVTDPEGNAAATWFYITVVPGNLPPTISQFPHTNTLVNTPISIPFTIGDDQTAVGSLALSTSSGNQSLVPDANISITGTAPNLTVTVTPVAGSNGVAPINITVTDGAAVSTTRRFTVTVRPTLTIAAYDDFSYDSGGAIIDASAGLWLSHGGTPGQADVSGGVLNLVDTESEDVSIPLIGAPYSTNGGAVYSSFLVQATGLPSEGGAYFAHFKDGGTFNLRGRVWTSTLNAEAGKYRLGIGNTTGTTNTTAQLSQDLDLNTFYRVVTRLVVSNGVSTIWVNPASESDPSATDNTVVTELADVTTYAFRQATAFGNITVDDLRVGTSFASVMGLPEAPPSVPLTITTANGQAIVSWTDATGLFKLATGTNVLQVTNVISGATSPYTNNISGAQTYFRLVYP